jgi:hypothetical protein
MSRPLRLRRRRDSGAGGMRTHDLELMRLARTAAPLPRKSGWQESNLRSPAPEAGGVASSPTARCPTSATARARGGASPPSRRSGRGWDRTSGLLCVRQALCRLSYSPWIRDKDSNPDLHVQSVASFRVRRSRSGPVSPRTPGWTGVRAAARQVVPSVPSSTSPTVFSKPLAYSSTLDRLRPSCAQPTEPSYVEESWSPIAARRVKNSMLKLMHLSKRNFIRGRAEHFLSQAGPRFDLGLVQAEHHPSVPGVRFASETTKATFRSPSLRVAIRLVS